MYKRLSSIMFPIVTILLIGTLVWGYQEHQEKNSILIKAENNYQRAFHDLSFHMDKLNGELGSALAVNSSSQTFHRKCLVNAWRLTSEAQNEINQLPLSLVPFSKTEEFLSKIANFTYRTAIRDYSKKPLTPEEMKVLKTLHEKSKQITSDLRQVQAKALSQNLRWMDVELALATENENQDNTIIDGFKTVDNKVNEYPEIEWGPSVTSMYQKRTTKMLAGKDMSQEEIKKKALKFFGNEIEILEVVENGKGTEYQSYSVRASRKNSQHNIQMDFTKKGGQLIWFLDTRDIKQKKLSINEAEKAASQFLKKHEFGNMETISYDEYENVASLTYSTVQNGIIILPEKLVVKVALDNGDVTGLQANDYIYEKHARKIGKPQLSMKQARQRLNPDYKVVDASLALILNDVNEEVLTYQFLGKINGSMYRIYVHADTGEEEKIEEIKNADAKAAEAI